MSESSLPSDVAAEITLLQALVETQQTTIASLQQQLDWFKRQLFGEKSEKRHNIDPARQADMLAGLAPVVERPSVPEPVRKTTQRRKRRSAETVTL